MRFRPKIEPNDVMRLYRETTGDDQLEQTDEIVTTLRAILYAQSDATAEAIFKKKEWFSSVVATELFVLIIRRKYEKLIRSGRKK